MEPKLLAPIALLQDLPASGLVRGQVGTIVEILAPGVFEVEFSDDNGQAYASVALKTDQLLVLHNNQVAAA